MSVTQFWFARRFPVGSPRNAMAPVSWQGYAIVTLYVTLLMLGALAFAWLGASGDLILGATAFTAAAVVGASLFIGLSNVKGDKARTVAEYQKDASRV